MTEAKNRSAQLLVAVGLVVAAVWGMEAFSNQILRTHHTIPSRALGEKPSPSLARDGARLAHLDGCFGCHGSDLTGNIVFRGWLGTRLVAPNLTRLAHRETDAQLAAAIRYGIKPDGTSVIVMPSSQLIKSSDSDIAAIIAYLHSLPERPDATGNTDWRLDGRAMLVSGLLPASATKADLSERGPVRTPTEPYALGHYLTQSHCSGCHGTDLTGKTLEGSPNLRISIFHYSPAAFEHFFRTGEGQIGHGTKTMTRMIRTRFKYLSAADVHAIYVYLTANGLPL